MPTNTRVDIFRVPVDAAGDPDIIQLPEGSGPFRKITASIVSPLATWTLFAPLASSNSKVFAPGSEYVFEKGPYQGNDVLGYVSIGANSSFMLLFCER